ncbi:MAG: glycosyltransferase [Myxococcota bacterium]
MKVLHLFASPFFTGPAEAITQLALAQRALGHEVFVAVDRKRHTTTSEELLVPRLEPLGLLSSAGLELSVKSSPLALLRDVRRLSQLEVDVVHCHFSHDHTLARLGRPRGALLVRSLHAPRSLRWSLPAADAFTVPMDSMTRGLLGHRVLVLPALVGAEFQPAVDRFALRRELGLPAEGRLLGMVSTFQPSRRHSLGLEAFARRHARDPSLRLVLVGDGPLEGDLRARAAPLGEAVRFVGYQSGPAFVRHLQALDEVWLLGLGNDWSARAAAQARACGVRVVAVDEGALGRYADALAEPEVDSLVAASEAGRTRELKLESPEAIARRVLEFYGRAG